MRMGFFYYAVVEVECLCCANYGEKHRIIGVFDNEITATRVKAVVDKHRKKVGLPYPHSTIYVLAVPPISNISPAYKSMFGYE
jgi:hypothetical protein